NPSQYLPAPDIIADPYSQASWLKVKVVGKLPITQVENNGVAANSPHSDRDCGMEILVVPGHVIRKSIYRCDDLCGRDRQDGFTIRIISERVTRFSGK